MLSQTDFTGINLYSCQVLIIYTTLNICWKFHLLDLQQIANNFLTGPCVNLCKEWKLGTFRLNYDAMKPLHFLPAVLGATQARVTKWLLTLILVIYLHLQQFIASFIQGVNQEMESLHTSLDLAYGYQRFCLSDLTWIKLKVTKRK